MAFDLVAAIAAVRSGGGRVEVPPGQWYFEYPIVLPENITLYGHGPAVSVIVADHDGDALRSSWPRNSSTAVNIALCDLGIATTATNNTGAAFSDTGGSYVHIDRITTTGFARGIQFDQTEVSSITRSRIQGAVQANIWLVNGIDGTDDHGQFTNRITIGDCQIDILPTAVGIVDDGGYSHTIRECNFNGGARHIVASGVLPLTIRDSEFEGAVDAPIMLGSTRFFSGGGVGQSDVLMEANVITPQPGKACIECQSAGTLTLLSNRLGNSTAPKLIGMANVASYFGRRNANGGGPIFDGTATDMDTD